MIVHFPTHQIVVQVRARARGIVTWTNAALVDRRRWVQPLGNTATGQPDIPNRTSPEVGFSQRNRHIHQDLTSFVREVAARRQKLDFSIATRPADWGQRRRLPRVPNRSTGCLITNPPSVLGLHRRSVLVVSLRYY